MSIARFAVVPPLPRLSPPPVDVAAPRRCWKVMHACDTAELVLPVAHAQIEAGMRPSLLTPDGCPTSGRFCQMCDRVALLHASRDLLRWRRLLAAEAGGSEILHTHCLAACLAGVLGGHIVVHDLRARASLNSGPWLLRRAEEFALARAAAVVVHSQHRWAQALRRGVAADDLFLVPDPIEPCGTRALACARLAVASAAPDLPAGGSERSPTGRCGSVTLFAPDVTDEAEVSTVLSAFAMLACEVEGAQLLLAADGELAVVAMRRAQELEIAPAMHIIAFADVARALPEADVVIAGGPRDSEPNATALAALAHGRALLAADVPQNREVTPQGSGCVWYRAGSDRDLAYRAAFLARNPDFRAALTASGRAHLAATRGPALVARACDEVYRHAWRKRSSGPGDVIRQLVLQASL